MREIPTAGRCSKKRISILVPDLDFRVQERTPEVGRGGCESFEFQKFDSDADDMASPQLHRIEDFILPFQQNEKALQG